MKSATECSVIPPHFIMLCELVLQQLFTEKVQMLFTTEREKFPKLQPLNLEILAITHLCFKISLFKSGRKKQKFELLCVSSHQGDFSLSVVILISKYFPTEF